MLNNQQRNKIKSKFASALKRTKKRYWECFFPKCNQKSINSHSQSKSSSLNSIQENGHIMERRHLFFPPTKMWGVKGVRQATTFPGFCEKHDTKLFNRVDQISKNKLEPETLTLLAFRTFALEMRKKEYWAEYIDRVIKSDLSCVPDFEIEVLEDFRDGMINCLKVTKPHHMKKFSMIANTPSDIRMFHKIFRYDKNLGISCSSFINPSPIDPYPLSVPQPFMSFNVLPRKSYTLVITSCFPEDFHLLNDFLDHFNRLEDLIFNFCEEVVMNLSLYESLDGTVIDAIEKAQESWVSWKFKKIPDIFHVQLNNDFLFIK